MGWRVDGTPFVVSGTKGNWWATHIPTGFSLPYSTHKTRRECVEFTVAFTKYARRIGCPLGRKDSKRILNKRQAAALRKWCKKRRRIDK